MCTKGAYRNYDVDTYRFSLLVVCAMCTRVSKVVTRFTEKHKEAYTQEKIFNQDRKKLLDGTVLIWCLFLFHKRDKERYYMATLRSSGREKGRDMTATYHYYYYYYYYC